MSIVSERLPREDPDGRGAARRGGLGFAEALAQLGVVAGRAVDMEVGEAGDAVRSERNLDHSRGQAEEGRRLNAELSAAVYSKLDQKSVAAWLDLRNKVAHGNDTEYTGEQVRVLLQGVRDYSARHLRSPPTPCPSRPVTLRRGGRW
jgi:hypothetical protein